MDSTQAQVEEELLEIFKLYSYKEILKDGKQFFVLDVDGFIKALVYKGYRRSTNG